MQFDGQAVLVTGASSGIGRALALEFARQGAAVAACARREPLLQQLLQEIVALGRRGIAIVADVDRDGDCTRAVQMTVQAFGRLDVAVANAGFGVTGNVRALSVDDFRRQLETNVFGVLRTVQAALPELQQTRGRLAIVGSVSGHLALPGTAPYAMSKFAVRALAECLWWEERERGIAVTLISPGFVASEIRRVDNAGRHHPTMPDPIPAWLVMPVAKAARQIVRAIARRRREFVVTGHGKAAVWLQRHLPAAVSLALRLGMRGRRSSGS